MSDTESLPGEEFRDIEGWEGYYQISNKGRVKSLRYKGREGVERIRKPGRTPDGYIRIRLMSGDRDERHSVARLVAQAFVPNPENKPQVNHINSVRDDNRAENLEWVTASENMKHGLENGFVIPPENPRPEGSGKSYIWEHESGEVFEGTAIELSREYGLHHSHLYDVANGVYSHSKGWRVV